ncbi:porin family protein [Patiriisocius hiemis]|uniref:Porin family protein n=1 Tax=Patiriisocius hiemis TaxID=3075604 RepID=A0ABU2YBH2_9FLAO|nr:porin family protein [Constantimarinum sp. W242]MDT0554984.1 porin family protein [Constantimarinum sp. W242]
MKKLLVFAAIAVISITSVNAQETMFGVKAGVNFASIVGDDVEDASSLTGFNVGAVASIGLSDVIAIQPEVVFSGQGAKDDEDGEFKTKLGYVNVPVLLSFTVVEGLSLQAGPQIGINITAQDEFDGETEDIEGVNTLDLSGGFGAQYYLEDIGAFAQLRYTVGFNSIFEDFEGETFDAKNSVLSISVGWFF